MGAVAHAWDVTSYLAIRIPPAASRAGEVGGIQIGPHGSGPYAMAVHHDGSFVDSWHRHCVARNMQTESGIFGCFWLLVFFGGFLTVPPTVYYAITVFSHT